MALSSFRWMGLTACLLIYWVAVPSSIIWAQGTESGVIEKSLRQSRPDYQPPAATELPEIVIQDSRTLEDAGAGPSFMVTKVRIEGNHLIDDETLAPLVDIGEGMEMTLGILTLMANEITALYSSQGYFLTRAYIPEQEIKDGVVTLQVVEGRVGKINVTGNQHVDEKDLSRHFWRVQGEEVLQEQTLESTLLEINDLMGVQVRSTLTPGELPGTSDLVLEVNESRPYTFSFDGDNFGSGYTGIDRFGFSFAAGSMLRLGDQFSMRYVRSDFGQDFYNPSFLFPLNYMGTKLKLSYTFSEHELGKELGRLNAGGSSTIYSLELSQLLQRSRTSQVQAYFGAEVKSYENEQLGENTSLDNLHEVYFRLGGNYSDTYQGRTFYDVKTQFGLNEGDVTRQMSSRTKGDGNALVASMNLTRYQSARKLFENHLDKEGLFSPVLGSYLVMKFNGQVTNKRVLSPNQISIGGSGTVRGYPLSENSGDNGYAASLEYVLPFPLKIKLAPEFSTLDKTLSLVGFVDHGKVFVRNKEAGEKDQSISGAGGGFRLNFARSKPSQPSVSFSMLYGLPVLGSPETSDHRFGTIYVSGIITY